MSAVCVGLGRNHPVARSSCSYRFCLLSTVGDSSLIRPIVAGHIYVSACPAFKRPTTRMESIVSARAVLRGTHGYLVGISNALYFASI